MGIASPRGERLARYLARCGVASRRVAEAAFIAAGRVKVDGRTVSAPGTVVLPDADVRVDGRRILPEAVVTLALHKPVGVVSTVRDPRGRLTVLDLVPDPPARVYPVGRLDYDSEGLVLLSNDGPLTSALLHPRHAVRRRYALFVTPAPADAHLARLHQGVRLSDGLARAAAVRRLPAPPRGVPAAGAVAAGGWVELVLQEGRNRQARRMCAAVGLDTLRLVRLAFGPVELGRLAPGMSRRLSVQEVAALRAAARGGSTARPPASPPPPRTAGAPPAPGSRPRARGMAGGRRGRVPGAENWNR